MATVARPRRSPNRVRLVELDGSPVVRPTKDHALSWPDSTDNWRWAVADEPDRVIGVDSMGADVHRSDVIPEPDRTDEEWLARLEEQEALEKARVLATYEPLPEDLEEYAAYCEALESGAMHPAEAGRFESSPVRSGQVSDDELSQLASHGCI